jgi:hypothetical protein
MNRHAVFDLPTVTYFISFVVPYGSGSFNSNNLQYPLWAGSFNLVHVTSKPAVFPGFHAVSLSEC